MKIGVIVSAYDNWRALDFTLLGFRVQTRPPAELIVAEDSEFPQVADVVARHAALARFPIRHLHHADQGFRKGLILNRAIAEATAPFLVFTDADCIPRADLLATYERTARPGRFVSAGSHVNLPESFHQQRLTAAMVGDQRVFDRDFLALQGVLTPWSRLLKPGPLPALLDTLTPRNAFVGNNSGAYRVDLLRVAGFDEAMGYGAEDSNLGIRLNHANVYGFRARHTLVSLHLDHPRSYRHEDQVRANQAWNRQLAKTATTLPRQSVLLPRKT
jgi:cellulose synthase/poly-beta-1,6-N-acetylglucosamine synthase-like glycosyltransferase